MFEPLKNKISGLLNEASKENLDLLRRAGFRFFILLFASYIAAAFFSSLVAHLIIGLARPKSVEISEKSNQPSLNLSDSVNYRTVKKDVLDRNLFNRDGEFPPDDEKKELAEGENNVLAFDESAPCRKTTLPIDLLGTILITPSSASLATVKEKGYSEADIYREGDTIVGYEGAKVHRIEMEKVVLNNAGVKECLELALPSFQAAKV